MFFYPDGKHRELMVSTQDGLVYSAAFDGYTSSLRKDDIIEDTAH